MRARWIVPVGVALIVVPVAAADIGPHSSLYDQHRLHGGEQRPNVSVLLDRTTQVATVDIQNYCIGALRDQGTRYPDTAQFTLHVHGGKLSFSGTTPVVGAPNQKPVTGSLAATVRPKQVTGSATFPQTKCGTIRFVAPLVEHTP